MESSKTKKSPEYKITKRVGKLGEWILTVTPIIKFKGMAVIEDPDAPSMGIGFFVSNDVRIK